MTKCKSCGADIIWVQTDRGSLAPLSAVSKQKRFIIKPLSNDVLVGTLLDTYLSHFADCPNAERHRKKSDA